MSSDNTPNFDNMTPEEIMAWMESLAKRQGADEGFTTAADVDVPEIDPNSVVRETEAGFISSSASSSLQDFLNRINKIYAPSGNLAPEARLGLIRQLNSLAKQATMFQAQRVARHSGEMKNLGFNPSVSLEQGIEKTIYEYRKLKEEGKIK